MRHRIAATITLLGGAAMMIGALLTFSTMDLGRLPIPAASLSRVDTSIQGIDRLDGKVFLAAGITLVVLGALMWTAASMAVRSTAAVLITAVAGFMLAVAIIGMVRLEDQGLQEIAESAVEREPSLSAEDVRGALESLNVSFTPGIGLYTALIGSVLGVVGGFVGLLDSGTKRTSPAPPNELPPGEGSATSSSPGH